MFFYFQNSGFVWYFWWQKYPKPFRTTKLAMNRIHLYISIHPAQTVVVPKPHF